MEFLVRLETQLPATMSPAERNALLERESAQGRELRRDGVIKAIWRLPGRLANVGIWTVDGAEALHSALASLPAWPWMTVTVTTLAAHPLMSDETQQSSPGARPPAEVPQKSACRILPGQSACCDSR
ncbi:muconolactone Delta-isomerase family protein [Streptomyces sp. NBC_00353]|uniref:muconolactone Delta-isomerase n=1 Tax=Streptomyces sp. NBC_00353 TaxID=2975722 RepID=UPI002E275EC9